MRNIFICLLLAVLWAPVSAQINKAEYFIDTDPGIGSATAIPVVAANDITVSFNVPLTNVANGLHTLYVRTRDAQGNWSLTAQQSFFTTGISTLNATVNRAEYFIDSDPGIGKGAPVTIPAGHVSDSVRFKVDLKNVTTGFHTLYLRTEDSKNSWSLTSQQAFFVNSTNPDNIASLQYDFIKTGFSSPVYTYKISTPSPSVSLAFKANLSDLPANQTYTMEIYALTTGGLRSLVATKSVTVNEPVLSNLIISNGTLTPAFSGDVNSYTASVGNSTTSINVTPIKGDTTETVKVNGTMVTAGSPAVNVPLTIGANTINVTVTAQNGTTTNTYTITVTRPSNNANLAGLSISSGTLAPAFSSPTTSYTATVGGAVTSITLTPTTSDANATVKVNGTSTLSGTASAGVALKIGVNSIYAVVLAQDGTRKTYTVAVTRLSNNANLANLTISSGTLTPAFASATTSYTASVSNATSSIKITPTTSDNGATLTVNGVATPSGTASASITLKTGANNIYAVVLAQDGTRRTYTITVTRAVSNNANLSNLTISSGTLTPAFVFSTTGYTASVSNATSSIKLTPTTSDVNATVQVNGVTVTSGSASASVPLTVGANAVYAVVHAQDGTQRTYTVTVTRLSNVANLANLTISSGALAPAFIFSTTAYTDTVSNTISSVTLTPTTNEAHASVKVNGTAVTSGTASSGIPLIVGNNSIYAVVLAQDGTRRTYTITVRRLIPGGLNSLYLPGNGEQTPLISSLGVKVEASNILSPNGDGINDVWVVKNIAFYPNNTVTVYDGTGRIVFTKKGYANDWAGTYRGAVLSEGTYNYLIDLGNGSTIKGFITVVRDK